MIDRLLGFKSFRRILCISIDAILLLTLLFHNGIVGVLKITSPFCILDVFLGLKCALCGGTHCVEAMIAGNFSDAVTYNALVFTVVLLILFTVALLNISALFRAPVCVRILRRIITLKTFLVLTAITVVFTILRNVVLCI